VVWEVVDKVEMEVTEELREVMQDGKAHSQCSLIEGCEGSGGFVVWMHVHLQEGEEAADEVLELEVLVKEYIVRVQSSLVIDLLLHVLPWLPRSQLLMLVLADLEEVRHEVLVGDEFDPGEGECGELVGV